MLEWNEAQVETLKSMWLDGGSASEIARALGNGATRSSVIGKVHRLHLPSHGARHPKTAKVGKPAVAAAKSEGKRGAAGTSRGLVTGARRARALGGLSFKINQARKDGLNIADGMAAVLGRQRVPFDEPPEGGVDVSRLLSLMQLNEHTCKWPIGDPIKPDFGFCGAHADAAPYCDHHRKRAFHHL